MKTKQCSNKNCLRVLPITMFHRCAQNSDGLAGWCKECQSTYQQELWKRNKAKKAMGLSVVLNRPKNQTRYNHRDFQRATPAKAARMVKTMDYDVMLVGR